MGGFGRDGNTNFKVTLLSSLSSVHNKMTAAACSVEAVLVLQKAQYKFPKGASCNGSEGVIV